PRRPPLFPYTTLFRSELAAAPLRDVLVSRVVREREDDERPLQVGEIPIEGRLGEAEVLRERRWRQEAGELAGQHVEHSLEEERVDRKSTRLNSSHVKI